MSARVLLRAESGRGLGTDPVRRSRAVAEEVLRLGGEALVVVDDRANAEHLRRAGLEAWSLAERPGWALESAAGAWLDGCAQDWSADLRRLARRGTPSYLVANRTAAREWASFVVQPHLFVEPDPWERVHAARSLHGAPWIPLAAEVRAQRRERARDLDLLVTSGEPGATERVLAALPAGLRVAVEVGAHEKARRASLTRAAAHLDAHLLPPEASLAPWIARARAAVTSLGTTLYELIYLGTPALVLSEACRAARPFLPRAEVHELDERALAAALTRALSVVRAPSAPVPGLGDGATRIAERLLARAAADLAA